MDLDSIPLAKLIGNLQTYKLGLARVGKGSKDKNMALKFIVITRQFKKFIKNVNVKSGDKDQKQFAFSLFKFQDKGKREFKDASQGNSVPTGPKCYRCQGFGHMK